MALGAAAPLVGSPAHADDRVVTLSVTREQDMRFGSLVVTASSADVTVPLSGLPSYTGAVPVRSTTGPARFVLRGKPNKQVEVLFAEQLSGSFGGTGRANLDSLTVAADYSTNFQRTGGTVRLRLDASGVNTLTFGGRLRLQAGQARGTLSIPIALSARYYDS